MTFNFDDLLERELEERRVRVQSVIDANDRNAVAVDALGPQFDEIKNPQELEESIHAALRQADSYDRQVFESLGVKTIWVDSFSQVTQVIDAIATS